MTPEQEVTMIETVAKIDERTKTTEREVKILREKVENMELQASKWKGGFLVAMGLGGVITTFVGWALRVFNFHG